MDVVEQIEKVVKELDELDKYTSCLNQQLSIVDGKLQDVVHYIECNKINVLTCYNLVKKIKTLRVERRKIKEDMELSKRYDELKHKLATNMNNRKIILGELRGKKKQLNTEYKPRQYNEQDMEKILKGV